MLCRGLQVGVLLVLSAIPAWPCTLGGDLPTPAALVQQAQVIVRARAEGLSDLQGRTDGMAAAPTQVRFTVIEVLKGTVSQRELSFNGQLASQDDPNDRPVPYDFVRPRGREGSCFALYYRAGGEYLLLLRRSGDPVYAQPNALTPYWSALSPTNEQLFGGRKDSWLLWVVRQLSRGPGA
jgi:hypothetical protein